MNEKLDELNRAPRDVATKTFLDCCGSQSWAKRMTEARPFADFASLIECANEIWQNLEPLDWLEAFAAHPKIGARKAAPKQQAKSAEWSKGEQAQVHEADEKVLESLAEANRLYEEKFGYIYIVCATGKSADEMLEICERRMKNDSAKEIRIAAEEQRKITEIRLRKLINQ